MNTRPTVMEVNLTNLSYNIKQIQKYIGNKELIPVIKANGYGSNINEYLPLIKPFKIVAVATTDEGKYLRELGYKNAILILNQPSIQELDKILKYNLIVGLSSNEFLDELIKRKSKIKVHLEIETGMYRTGISLNNLSSYIEKLTKNKNIQVEGIYTHLSSADSDKYYTINQLENFDKAITIVQEKFKNIKYIHALASTGIINYLNYAKRTNAVRAGIILYGYYPCDSAMSKIFLKPILKLKTKITFLKEVPKNTPISYSKTYLTKKTTSIATIPIGYADGLRRALSNKGFVIIKGKKCKIVGNICMDSCMVDVSSIKDVKVGDDVFIWDNENIKVEDLAKICKTINYEIISTISKRVPRIYIS